MEQIGLASTIIGLILAVGFIFLANKLDKDEKKSTIKSKKTNENKNTFGGVLTTLLFFIFLITFFLSALLSCSTADYN